MLSTADSKYYILRSFRFDKYTEQLWKMSLSVVSIRLQWLDSEIFSEFMKLSQWNFISSSDFSFTDHSVIEATKLLIESIDYCKANCTSSFLDQQLLFESQKPTECDIKIYQTCHRCLFTFFSDWQWHVWSFRADEAEM